MTKQRRQDRQDHYYRQAKRDDFRSRAAYKLEQIQVRHRIMSKGDRVLEVGAAPGGWSQVALGIVGPDLVVGVDLQSIVPITGVTFLRGDVRDTMVQESIATALAGRADAIISDISPKLSGAYTTDHARSIELVEVVLELAQVHLRPGGNLVCKAFDGDLMPELLVDHKPSFRKLSRYRPQATRGRSSEVYLIGIGFRPGKVVERAEDDLD